MFAAVAALATLTPALGTAAVAPFLLAAGVFLLGIRDGEWFETLALPGDREEERLYGVGAFALALAGLAVVATFPPVPLPTGAFAAAALAVGGGRLGRELVRTRSEDEFRLVAGYLVAGGVAAVAGQIGSGAVATAVPAVPAAGSLSAAGPDALVGSLPEFAFLGSVAVLTAALVRSLVYARDAHITVVVVALVAWGFTALDPTVTAPGVVAALAVTAGLGYVSYALGAASVPGMLTGVLLSLLTVVLGGVAWFLTLMAFYAGGGLASKYRFDEKADRGVAQENQGARGTGNVLANSAVALVALLGYAAAPHVGVPESIFRLAFAGAIATAMADTLSSEIGGLFDAPRLITTLRPVEPGTDGAVTWQGEVAGLAGAALIALLAAAPLPVVDPVVEGGTLLAGVGTVVLAGVVGMTVDSVLGALIEGDRIGNQAVNFLATLSGAALAVAVGVVGVGVAVG
ncbi:TIGR00297 family protein [Halorubrum aquaticum]